MNATNFLLSLIIAILFVQLVAMGVRLEGKSLEPLLWPIVFWSVLFGILVVVLAVVIHFSVRFLFS
jgi:hypothetical protein